MQLINYDAPVNKVAAIVVSENRDKERDFKRGDKICSMSPLPTRQFTGPKKDDLTGRKCGRFTVIGCALWLPKNHLTSSNNTRWVVRCSCGRYQMLTTKAVKNNHPQTACVECARVPGLQKQRIIMSNQARLKNKLAHETNPPY